MGDTMPPVSGDKNWLWTYWEQIEMFKVQISCFFYVHFHEWWGLEVKLIIWFSEMLSFSKNYFFQITKYCEGKHWIFSKDISFVEGNSFLIIIYLFDEHVLKWPRQYDIIFSTIIFWNFQNWNFSTIIWPGQISIYGSSRVVAKEKLFYKIITFII